MLRRCFALMAVLLLSVPVVAAPELSEADRERLADSATDNDGVLDQQDGLYVLLRNASEWASDDFGGDAGAATAPPPDYAFIKNNPEQARGQVFRIEGWFFQQDRFPSTDNHGRDQLFRSGDPAWGDQVTRWMLTTKPPTNEEEAALSWVIVLLNDPEGQVEAPERRTKVAVAARFYKLWTTKTATGETFTYPVFVGGATETVADAASASGGNTMEIVLIAIVAVTGAFFVIRHLLNRGGGGNLTQQRLEEIRLKREKLEDEQSGPDEEEEDLPEDPVQALEALRQRHEQTP